MLESERKARNELMLNEMHPVFRLKVQAVLTEMESYQLRPRIQTAWRSPEDQMRAYNSGNSRLQFGFHNATAPDGIKEALAADIIDDNRPLGPKLPYILHLAAAAQNNGLASGAFFDLDAVKTANLQRALTDKNWNAPVHIGWDPCHIEITGITIQEARDGKRPEQAGGGVSGGTSGSGNLPLPTGGPPAAGGTTTPASGTTDPGGTTTPAAGTTQPGGATQPAGGATPSPAAVEAPADPHLTRYRVLNSRNDKVVDYDLGSAFRPVILLPVPYMSQLGTGADAHKNDCGAVSALMLLDAYRGIKMTSDEFYTRFNLQGDPYLTQTQIRNAISSLGLLTDFRANLSFQDIFTFMASGKPVIALLRYKVLYEAGLTEKTFQGPHFAVVVGIDAKYVYVHDPLYTDPAAGEAHPYPLDVFWQAWKEVALVTELANPERSAIIPVAGIGFRMARKLRVKSATLPVRSGPGPSYGSVGLVRQNEIYEITREMNSWGEIGTDRWISLVYTAAVS